MGRSFYRRHMWHWIVLAVILGALLTACGGSKDVSAPDGLLATALSNPPPVQPTVTPDTPTPTVATATPTEPPPVPTATSTVTPSPTATVLAPTPTLTPIPSGGGDVEPDDGDDRPVIVLDPGHDRMFPSALGIEYQVNLRTALIAQELLEEAGYRVYLTRTTNDFAFLDDQSLLPENAEDFPRGYSHAYAHASKALQFDPDLILQLHYNGHPDPAVSRLEVYYCENGGPQNLVLAEIVLEELLVSLNSIGYQPQGTLIQEDLSIARGNRHFPSLGNVYDAPRTYLYNRYEGIPTVLTEPLYLTNATGFALLEDEATHIAIAEAYVRAIDRYFGR